MIVINKEFSGLDKDIKIKLFKNIKLNFNTKNELDINKIFVLNKLEKIKPINEQYSKLVDILSLDSDIQWKYLIGDKNYKLRVNEIRSCLNKLKLLENEYIKNVLYQRYVLNSFIKGCTFDGNDYVLPVYDHVSSKTGRTKISEGLNFLTLKKEKRKSLKSIQKNGRIYEIDIVSLEPRVFAKITRDEQVYDICDHIAKNVLNESHQRKNVKLGLIATLYGATSQTVKKLSGLDKGSVAKIKEWFKLKDLKQMINLNDQNDITNFYGRTIFNSESKINHYIQSSACDCALLSFLKFIKNAPVGVNLIATIHDAIILDVSEDNFNYIESLEYLYEEKMDIKLPVKGERLS